MPRTAQGPSQEGTRVSILTSENRPVKADMREDPRTQLSGASSPLPPGPYSNECLPSLLDQISICLYTTNQPANEHPLSMSTINWAAF